MLRRTVSALLLLIATVQGCATNPVSGEKEVALMSEEKEIEVGREMDPQVRKQYGVYDDPELQAYVQRVGEKLAGLSHRPELFYRFTVLDSDVVNAFALPGGYIYVTRGLLAYLNTEAELAAVLGHELGHVTARHAVRQYTTAMAAQIGYTIGAIFVPEVASQAGSALYSVLGTALVRGYGRQHELESDRLGAQYLALAGYDPQAMISVLEVLKNQEQFEIERAKLEGREANVYHGLFATHPSNDQRLQEVVTEAKPMKVRDPSSGRDAYLAHLDGMVFGDSVRQGVRHGHRFYHRSLGFALTFPKGWRIDNYRDRLAAGSRDRAARMVVKLERLNRRIAPSEFMRERLKLKDLRQQGELEGMGLPSYTGVTRMPWTFGSASRDLKTRVSVIFFKDRAYVFYGTTRQQEQFSQTDRLFLDAARSFHALTPAERKLANGLRIEIVEAKAGTTFEKLANKSPIPNYPERILRLLNDHYPTGEPAPASKIKVIR
ncbi:MAG: M48 family metalloprotease [Acidiferrobacterales bacterium]